MLRDRENLLEEKYEKLRGLVSFFGENIDRYKSKDYDEANTRVDFIDKFFELLDWDVRNEQQFSEDYREVVREDSVIIEGKPKAPDYSFKIGGVRKFFVEAKRPSIDIKEDIGPAFQVRRYSYTAKLPLSILTDFEEFAIYDTRIKPHKNDKASVARIFYCTFREYEEKFNFIYNAFSKYAILKGSFSRYVDENKNKKGTSEIDREFLSTIENWRSRLAKNIALRNPAIEAADLNYAVQKIIDRFLFLRIAEDRHIEEYGNLKKSATERDVYSGLKTVFTAAEEKYDSGLFRYESSLNEIKIDDRVLSKMIDELYYPECAYEFSVLPVEILGNIYEQFLGKTIRLTASHIAKVEEKPEIRKSGGVYYTPDFIVRYIVKETVGRKIQGQKPDQISKLRVLDPACGSGSFLVCVYSCLLKYHLDYYLQEKQKNSSLRARKIFQVSENTYRLTIEEKQRILLNNIYGVDIDHQATEVTRLSLLLKLMEDEYVEGQGELFRHSQLKMLPDLSSNIKCGNSIIGTDIYDGQSNLSGEEEKKLNPFNWETEFESIFKTGGFDCIIGNPPYVRQESLGTHFKKYVKDHYSTHAGTADLYVYFIEKSLNLLSTDGLYSIIVANKWLRSNYGQALRKYLKKRKIHEIIDFGDLPVFQGATTYPLIIKVSNGEPDDFFAVKQNPALLENVSGISLQETVETTRYRVLHRSLEDGGWSLSTVRGSLLLEKLKSKGVPLGTYVNDRIFYGIKTGLNEAFVIDEDTKNELIKKDSNSAAIIKPFLTGKDIKRYKTPEASKWLIFTRRGINIHDYPAIENYLQKFKERLKPRPGNWKGEKKWSGRKPGTYKWYEIQDSIDYHKEFEKEKIIFPDISMRGNFSLDRDKNYLVNTSYIIPVNDRYLLGILNAKIITWYYSCISAVFRGGYLRWIYQYIEKLPIKNITSDAEIEIKSNIEYSVEQMMVSQRNFDNARTEQERIQAQRKIEYIDNRIDELVFRLYDLSPEEIRIVTGEREVARFVQTGRSGL